MWMILVAETSEKEALLRELWVIIITTTVFIFGVILKPLRSNTFTVA